MKITQAITPAEIEQVRELFREYKLELGEDLCFQDFEEELASLPGKYASPGGALLLGNFDTILIGCVAVRPIEQCICEMKRLYIHPHHRGKGYGEQLAHAIIAQAQKSGYTKMRLDTLQRLTAANKLYQQLGFKQIESYYQNPLPNVVYWELDLASIAR